MQIFTKLLLALLLTSTLLLLSLYWLMQWSFDRGMLNYVNQKELQSLQLLSDNLSRFYQSHESSWQDIIDSTKQPEHRPPKKPRLTKAERRTQRLTNKHNKRKRPADKKPPYWRMLLQLSQQGLHYPDDIELLRIDSKKRKSHRRLPQGEFKQPPPRPENGPRPSLLNAEKQILIGRYHTNYISKPIMLNSTIIGYVALPAKKELTDAFDINFSAQNSHNIALILFSIFILLLLITIPLSRQFTTPITRLKTAIVRLNKGKLKTRLTINGQDEIATLARNFNDLAATLEQNENSRKRWIADISHELRTPLAIIKGEIEALEDGIRTFDQQSLSSFSEEVNHLQKLINDLHELNNSEIGTMHYQKESIDLTALLHQNISRHQQMLQQKGLQFSSQLSLKPLAIWADETRLHQLFDNLLTNSIKYTDTPGEILVTLESQQNNAVILIQDSAPGVPEKALSKLFDHLYRVESSRNRKTGGLGIGLSLCKNIVHAHQGDITASASKIDGLAIKITLPLI